MRKQLVVLIFGIVLATALTGCLGKYFPKDGAFEETSSTPVANVDVDLEVPTPEADIVALQAQLSDYQAAQQSLQDRANAAEATAQSAQATSIAMAEEYTNQISDFGETVASMGRMQIDAQATINALVAMSQTKGGFNVPVEVTRIVLVTQDCNCANATATTVPTNTPFAQNHTATPSPTMTPTRVPPTATKVPPTATVRPTNTPVPTATMFPTPTMVFVTPNACEARWNHQDDFPQDRTTGERVVLGDETAWALGQIWDGKDVATTVTVLVAPDFVLQPPIGWVGTRWLLWLDCQNAIDETIVRINEMREEVRLRDKLGTVPPLFVVLDNTAAVPHDWTLEQFSGQAAPTVTPVPDGGNKPIWDAADHFSVPTGDLPEGDLQAWSVIQTWDGKDTSTTSVVLLQPGLVARIPVGWSGTRWHVWLLTPESYFLLEARAKEMATEVGGTFYYIDTLDDLAPKNWVLENFPDSQ